MFFVVVRVPVLDTYSRMGDGELGKQFLPVTTVWNCHLGLGDDGITQRPRLKDGERTAVANGNGLNAVMVMPRREGSVVGQGYVPMQPVREGQTGGTLLVVLAGEWGASWMDCCKVLPT